MKKMKQSPFCHFFKKGDIICAYHAIRMEPLYFHQKYEKKIQNYLKNEGQAELSEKAQKIVQKMLKNQLIVSDDFDASAYMKSLEVLMRKKPNIRVMVLHMTDVCNLRCRYCFIEGNIKSDYKRQNMTPEVIEKAIDKFMQITLPKKFKKKPAIVFYGGEPLMNWPVMLHGLKYLAEKYPQASVDKVLITNATLLTDEIAKELKKYDVGVSVSIDGPQNCHDANRVYCNGKGSFKDAVRGFSILRKAGIEPSASCVMSKETVAQAEEVIRWLVEEMRINALGFNHVSIVPSLNYYDEQYENAFAEAVLKVQDIIQQKYPHVYERRMNHKINCYLDKQIIRADCTGCGEQFSVSTTGEVGICQGYMGSRKTFNNSVLDPDFDPNTDEVFMEWATRSPFTMPECYDCAALATCGGGCPRNADVLSGSIWKRDLPFCHFAKKAQEWLIWKQFELEPGQVDYIR